MWFRSPKRVPDWSAAEAHLIDADPVLASVVKRVGPCTLSPRRDYFVALCQSIFSQQISTAVAAVLFERFRQLFPRRRPTPGAVLDLLERDGEALRGCGVSRQKRLYLADLARHFDSGLLSMRRLSRMSDEQVIEMLTEVKGVGRWTAEMFLIFTLNRPDLLPVDDLGLRKGIQKAHRLDELPGAEVCRELAEPWRPYRSIATWYLWRGL